MFVPWHLHDTYEDDKQEDKKESKPEDSEFINTAIKDKDKHATVYHRYYHVFREGELEMLIAKSHLKDKVKIMDRYYDHANWVVVLQKTAP